MNPDLNPMSPLKALIFDVDGTLAETERQGHRLAFNQAFAEAGLDWVWSEEAYGVLTQVGGGKERITAYIQAHHPEFQPPEPLSSFVAHLHHRKTHHYRSLLSQGLIPPRPGVVRLLQEARTAGIPLAIATTSILPNAVALLETTIAPDSPQWFQVIGAGDVVPQKKPAPDIYHYVLDHLGFAPEDCLVFEDSDQGLRAAHTAGLRTIVTVNDYTAQQSFTEALLVLNHLGDPQQPCTALRDPKNLFHGQGWVTLEWLQSLP